MKKFISIIVFVSGIIPFLNAQSYELFKGDTVNVIDKKGFKQGYWVEHKPFGEEKISEGNYVDGKKEGIWKSYYPGGTLKSEITYVHGKKYGRAKTYFENGNTAEEGVWLIDKWVNKYKAYYQNGKLSYVWNYNDYGTRSGYQRYYYENGNIKIEGNWENGKESGIIREYYPDGSLRSEKIFKDGKTSRDSITVYEIKEKTVVKTDSLRKNAFEKNIAANQKIEEDSADIHFESPDSLGIFEGDGHHIFYNKYKKKDKEGSFKNGYLIDGKQYFYDEKQRLLKTAVYKDGKIIKIIENTKGE
ncbi:MAG: toxin-antitoxin system YwqK family antitoxin [Chlorobi bacterium]|nr:toxin-antitoxin system YwqK family antitoxin [Chlorobiota bacterium]